MITKSPIAVYFHWPFCLAKCPYCDFNVHVTQNIDHALWRDAYLKAIDYYAKLMPDARAISIFFGGGTPSLMESETVKALIDAVKSKWPGANDMEVILEANPTSVETKKFEAFREAGVNRLSLGVQSLIDEDLKFLGRKHDVGQAITAIKTAREIFDRYSFDLMYARPNQKRDDWRKELEGALELANGHMSLYQLTIERSTPFFLDHAQGKFTMPDDGISADFYELTQEIMEGAGLRAYEVSNHARTGEESAHNLVYWRYGDYIGIGPGAHGRLTLQGKKFATREHSAPDSWLKKIDGEGFAHHPFEAIDTRGRFIEALMMGLRMRDGVSVEKLEREGQCSLEDILDLQRLEKMSQENWLLQDQGYLRLTRQGMLRLNAIAPYILKA